MTQNNASKKVFQQQTSGFIKDLLIVKIVILFILVNLIQYQAFSQIQSQLMITVTLRD